MIRCRLGVSLFMALHILASCLEGAVAFSSSKPLRMFAGASRANDNRTRGGRVSWKVSLYVPRQHSSTDGTEGESPSEKFSTITHSSNLSRRSWISSTTSCIAAAVAGSSAQAPTALASPPLTADVADNFSARLERSLRPKPAKVLRPRMNLDFAVLLMRSSYNAVDEIDVVAMDQFQRDFFLIRQAEYKPYADTLGAGAMQQGDLSDPNYFDFISFAQYATINRELADPLTVFEEQQPVEVGDGEPQRFDSVVVKRDPSLLNSDLSRRHTELVGNAILDKLMEKFGDTASSIPKIEEGSRPNSNTVLAAIKQMVNLFIISGFAWGGSASMLKNNDENSGDAAGTQFSITFTSPATLWSGQSLKAKNNAVLVNDFALKTTRALMSRAGYNVANASVKHANNQEITTFTIM